MITAIVTDLSECLLNYANLTSHHLPPISGWVLIPDKIVYKNIASFANAVGRVIRIKNRTIFIKLSNGRVINRAVGDVVSCAMNKHQQISLDPLDLPIFDDINNEQYRDINSQFEVFLPTISLTEQPGNVIVQHTVNPIRPRPTNNDDILVDPSYCPGAEAGAEQREPHPDTLLPGPRRSSRGHRPSWRYKERYTDDMDVEDFQPPP